MIGGWKMCLWFAASCSRSVNTLTFSHCLMLLAMWRAKESLCALAGKMGRPFPLGAWMVGENEAREVLREVGKRPGKTEFKGR